MRKKYKMTSFARFIIFMAIFAPLAFIGASYYNGENGIEKFKDLIGLNKVEKTEYSPQQVEASKDQIIVLQKQEIDLLKQKITELESRLAALESQQ